MTDKWQYTMLTCPGHQFWYVRPGEPDWAKRYTTQCQRCGCLRGRKSR